LLQITQPLREHLVAEPRDRRAQLGVPHRAFLEMGQDHRLPLPLKNLQGQLDSAVESPVQPRSHRWCLPMTPRWLLRIAAILSLLYCLGHTAGMPWTPSTGGHTDLVVGGMKSFTFDVFGSTRSYWDFYQGFGLTLTVLQLLGAVVLWLVAGL